MDPVSAGASLIAFFQLAERVISLCKFYIESVRDAPHDLRLILIEVTSLKSILENLDYLLKVDPKFISNATLNLWSQGGTVEASKLCLTQLEALFPKGNTDSGGSTFRQSANKRQKISQVATALAWPFKETKARRLLQEVSQHKTTITLALSAESSRDIKDVKRGVEIVQETLENSERKEFYRWLEPINPSDLHVKACDAHEKGTSSWMLQSRDWKDWINRKFRCLWIHGIPGAGKTVLSSHLIESIQPRQESSEVVASIYYYCYFGHNQDETLPLLGWVIGQLCRQARRIPRSLLSTYKKNGKPNAEQLLAGLADILASVACAYVVIDALDESKEPRDQILGVLELIATEPRFSKIQLLVTSREYFDIESVMLGCSVAIPMQIDQVQADIWIYVNRELRQNRRFLPWPEELRLEVRDALAVQAKGMFRWAVCQIDILKRLSTTDDIRRAISCLPETLDETYERIFGMISVHEQYVVQRALSLLCGYDHLRAGFDMAAPVLLSMTFENWNHGCEANSGHISNLDMLKEVCGCLITISSDGFVRLAHFTVKEFLFSERLRATSNVSIGLFALSDDTVIYQYMRTALTGILRYSGPAADPPDSVRDLYDHLLFFGFYATEEYMGRQWMQTLRDVALQAWARDGKHIERLRRILSPELVEAKLNNILRNFSEAAKAR